MTSQEYLNLGQLDEALAALQAEIRARPEDARLRIFLFQLLSVLGRWDRALTQLNVLADLDANSMMLAKIFTPVVHAEAFRTAVFAGQRSPLIFGEPEEWVGLLVQANALVARGEVDASRALREQAMEAAPAIPGQINGQAFAWIADADSRLGPVLEVFLDGKYYWVPFARIRKIEIEPPKDLRDLVWLAAKFTWSNGGEAFGFIPSRYAGTEGSVEDELKLARKTIWEEKGADFFLGRGQRLLATDVTEIPLFEITALELTLLPEPAPN
jgi:type VI secretion system protein ImpE